MIHIKTYEKLLRKPEVGDFLIVKSDFHWLNNVSSIGEILDTEHEKGFNNYYVRFFDRDDYPRDYSYLWVNEYDVEKFSDKLEELELIQKARKYNL